MIVVDPNQSTLSPEMPPYVPPTPKPRTAVELVNALAEREIKAYLALGPLNKIVGGWLARIVLADPTVSFSAAGSSPVRALRKACHEAGVEI